MGRRENGRVVRSFDELGAAVLEAKPDRSLRSALWLVERYREIEGRIGETLDGWEWVDKERCPVYEECEATGAPCRMRVVVKKGERVLRVAESVAESMFGVRPPEFFEDHNLFGGQYIEMYRP